jgi:hypothetical protein
MVRPARSQTRTAHSRGDVLTLEFAGSGNRLISLIRSNSSAELFAAREFRQGFPAANDPEFLFVH